MALPHATTVVPACFGAAGRVARHASEAFLAWTGAEATHAAWAPGRVNLIGEHTDYNGGFVLPFAIDLGIAIVARPREDETVRLRSTQSETEDAVFSVDRRLERGAPAWSNYVRGVIAGLLEAGFPLRGFDAVIDANLPAGGGLSSSAALEAATATLCEGLCGITLDPEEKALLCQKAEHEFAGTPCGIMDQFAVIFGRKGNLLLVDCQSRERLQVEMRGADAALVVVNTMVKHALVDGGYKSRRDDCYEAAGLLGVAQLRDVTPADVAAAQAILPERLFRRARHVTTENERTLSAVYALQKGEWRVLGGLMYASHASLKDDFEVSCRELDQVVEIARGIGPDGGVHGCRMTGGGFGGCCIALVAAERAAAIGEAISAQYRAASGIEPVVFVTTPSDGASLLSL